MITWLSSIAIDRRRNFYTLENIKSCFIKMIHCSKKILAEDYKKKFRFQYNVYKKSYNNRWRNFYKLEIIKNQNDTLFLEDIRYKKFCQSDTIFLEDTRRRL